MKVIFIKDLKGQGKKGEVVEVKDGYGSNFLIKNDYAVMATVSSMKHLDTETKKKETSDQIEINNANILKTKLEKMNIIFKVKTGDKDRVFGSISSKQIVSELKNLGISIDKHHVHLDIPIDSLGTHIVKLELHKLVIANLKIELVKER